MVFFRSVLPQAIVDYARMTAAAADATDNLSALRWAAWSAAVDGDIEAALRYLDHATSCAGDDGSTWFAKGLLLLGDDRTDAALAAFRVATGFVFAGAAGEQQAGRIAQALQDGNMYGVFEVFYDNFGDDFCFAVACRPITAAETQGYAFCMDRLSTFLQGHPDAIIAILHHDETLNQASYWSQVNAGHQYWLAGDRERADIAYCYGRLLTISQGLTPYHYNIGALTWLPAAAAQKLDRAFVDGAAHAPSGLVWILPDIATDWPELTISFSCDRSSVHGVLRMLLSICHAQEMAVSPMATVFHCHVAGADDGQIAILAGLDAMVSASFRNIRVAISCGRPAFRSKIYGSCLRLLLLPTLLQTWGCGVLLVPDKAVVDDAIFANIRSCFGHDAALQKYNFDANDKQIAGAPWSIGAQPLYVANVPIGRRFAGFVAGYIAKTFDPFLVTTWTIDRCALGQANWLMARSANARILNLIGSAPLVRFPEDIAERQGVLGSATLAALRTQLDAEFATEAAGGFARLLRGCEPGLRRFAALKSLDFDSAILLGEELAAASLHREAADFFFHAYGLNTRAADALFGAIQAQVHAGIDVDAQDLAELKALNGAQFRYLSAMAGVGGARNGPQDFIDAMGSGFELFENGAGDWRYLQIAVPGSSFSLAAAKRDATADLIPKRIIFYWDNDPPPEVMRNLEYHQNINEFDILFFNRKTAHDFLTEHFGPDCARLFLLSRHPAQESDFFRYHAINVLGGFYLDTDEQIMSADALLRLAQGCEGIFVFSDSGPLENGIFGSVARSEALEECLRIMPYHHLFRPDLPIWLKTGPGVLTRAVSRVVYRRNRRSEASLGFKVYARDALAEVIRGVAMSYRDDARDWRRFEAAS